MTKFNKRLSQLEATYQISKPVLTHESPTVISTFIKDMFKNSSKYDVLGELDKEWFSMYSSIDINKATNLIFNILQEHGYLISKKSILEGIYLYNKEI